MTATVQAVLFEKRAGLDDGAYWTSPASKHALRHILRGYAATSFKSASDARSWWESDAELRTFLRAHPASAFTKAADIGGDQEEGFEQAFGSLAYAYLKDKSPRLLDYIVGFQLVDRNEDNTKAVAIFGFKVGDQWLYAPVFFLNGDLKGHELLYIKKQDMFVPMKENWVNYLISRRPHVLGEGTDRSTHQLGGMQPNLNRLSRPPGGTKYGCDAWAQPALPVIAALATKKASVLFPGRPGELKFAAVVERPLAAALASVAANFDLRKFLGGDFALLKQAYDKCYSAYPLLKHGFDRFYGPAFFRDAAVGIKQARDSLVTRAAASTPPPPRPTTGPGLLLMPLPAAEKRGAIHVYALDVDQDVPVTDNKPELTDAEREKLLKDTVLIKDERDPQKTSIAYNTQVRLELVNPSDTGLYEVLEKPGKFDEMVVISNPHSGRGREDFALVLRKAAPRNWKNIHRTNLWARSCDCPTPDDWKKYVAGLGGVESLAKGGTYVAVHENGSGTCAFRVKESYGEGVYKVEWKDYSSYGLSRRTIGKLERPQDWEVGYSSWDAKVYINARKGSGLRSVNGELSIPDTYKIIKVSDPPKPKKHDDGTLMSGCCSPAESSTEEGSDEEPIQPGNLVDVQLMLHKDAGLRELKIHDLGGSEVVVKSGVHGTRRLSKTAALVQLVTRHGLREESARAMLKSAAARQVFNQAATFLVKYADPYGGNLQPAPGAPPFPEPLMGVEQNGPSSVNSIYPQEDYLPVEEMSSYRTDPSTYDPFYEPDQGAMQTAQQAAASGQKEVFDTAMISGMLKAVRRTRWSTATSAT
jgi:hypothetical protein